jgi:hypothetical protein
MTKFKGYILKITYTIETRRGLHESSTNRFFYCVIPDFIEDIHFHVDNDDFFDYGKELTEFVKNIQNKIENKLNTEEYIDIYSYRFISRLKVVPNKNVNSSNFITK